MPTAQRLPALALDGGAPIFLARVEGNDGSLITQSVVNAATYTIWQLNPNDPDARTVVTNHSAVSLTVGNIVFNALQLDNLWRHKPTNGALVGEYVDNHGYNLKVQPSALTTAPFAIGGAEYLFQVDLDMTTGENILVPWQVRCL